MELEKVTYSMFFFFPLLVQFVCIFTVEMRLELFIIGIEVLGSNSVLGKKPCINYYLGGEYRCIFVLIY